MNTVIVVNYHLWTAKLSIFSAIRFMIKTVLNRGVFEGLVIVRCIDIEFAHWKWYNRYVL